MTKLFQVSLTPAHKTAGGFTIHFCDFDNIDKTKIEATSTADIIEKAKAWAAGVGKPSRCIGISCLDGRKPAGFDRLTRPMMFFDLLSEEDFNRLQEAEAA